MIRAFRAWWANEDPATRLGVAGIVAVGAVARLSALTQPMRYDESVTYLRFIARSWTTAATNYQSPNNHLLYTVLAKLTALLGGGAPWALRLPAFVAGAALVPLTYAVGRALFTREAALVGAALAAGATPLILYSANARGFAFVAAAYLGLLLIAARIRARGQTFGRWAWFALIAAAGAATIPVMLFPLGAAALWLALTLCLERGRRALPVLGGLAAALAAAGALTYAAYLPIVRANGLGALVANRFVAPSPWPRFFEQFLPTIPRTLAAWTGPYPWELGVALVALGVAGVAQSARASREGVPVLVAAYAWVSALLLATHRAPVAHTWLWMLPVVLLSVGLAVEGLIALPRARRMRPYLPAFAVAAAVASVSWGFASDALGASHDTGVFAGARQIAQALATQAEPGDRVLASTPSDAPLQYYMLRTGADTALLSTPDSLTTRQIIVLNAAYDQTLAWAVAAGLVDTARFGPIAPAMHTADADVYVAERKGSEP